MIPTHGEPAATLEEEIKYEARRLGFVLAGVTTPEPPPHAGSFENWLALGRHGRMGYLASQRSRVCRMDPRQLMPDCKSILVLGMPYSNPAKAPRRDPQTAETESNARVAAYGWGRDYHDVIPDRLQELLAFIKQRAAKPVSSRCYTDTGPVLERDLAQRAGLGWIGKNTCLINPQLGSYFVLAEILLDLELRPDAAIRTDHCGSCTRCIQSCPTACILPDRTIEARQCIAYLTIELKDSIPRELRARMGGWIFGCDVCQIVCPWNRFAPALGEPALAADLSLGAPGLAEKLLLSPEEFAERARGSPLRRAKHRGYLRNVAVAAGNVAGTDVLASLRHLAEQDDPLIKEHADWALARVNQRTREDA